MRYPIVRAFQRAGAILGGTRALRTATDPAAKRLLLAGANPTVQLFDPTGACTAYASCWRVDWSIHGDGTVLIMWTPDAVTVYGTNEVLGRWLADAFVCHFPETKELQWTRPEVRAIPVDLSISLSQGMRAIAGDVEISAGDVLSPRMFTTEAFPLAGRYLSLSLVIGPCGSGVITMDGEPSPGAIQRGGTPERPTSSAFVTEAEVWQL